MERFTFQVDDETYSKRPSRTKFFFNPRMITNREVAFLALLVLVEERQHELREKGVFAGSSRSYEA